MRRFSFRLQSILDIRRHQEDQRRLELGAVVTRKTAVERSLAERQEMRRAILTELPGDIDAHDLTYRHLQAAYALRLAREIAALEQDLEGIEAERREAVQRYHEARQKAEALEKLKERRETAYRTHQMRTYQLHLDESAARVRRNSGHTIQ